MDTTNRVDNIKGGGYDQQGGKYQGGWIQPTGWIISTAVDRWKISRGVDRVNRVDNINGGG